MCIRDSIDLWCKCLAFWWFGLGSCFYSRIENFSEKQERSCLLYTSLEDREGIFAQIDKLEKEVLEKYEKALDDVLPQAFAIVKDTARRFSEKICIRDRSERSCRT